jgi:hypothetical protein
MFTVCTISYPSICTCLHHIFNYVDFGGIVIHSPKYINFQLCYFPVGLSLINLIILVLPLSLCFMILSFEREVEICKIGENDYIYVLTKVQVRTLRFHATSANYSNIVIFHCVLIDVIIVLPSYRKGVYYSYSLIN